MRKILVLGAGRSSPTLVDYLREKATAGSWEVFVADFSAEAARKLAVDDNHAIRFDIRDENHALEVISRSDVVVSLLPAAFQPTVASICLETKKSFFTASYAAPEMASMNQGAKAHGLLFLNECGLDPGIDHMSTLKLIRELKSEGAVIDTFESFTGGLIATDTDQGNPWRYKFTWNPGNVVAAGKGTACFLKNGRHTYLPYHRVFANPIPVDLFDGEPLEAYANRDSLKYIEKYELNGIKTMMRGTLRYPGYCEAWNTFVQLGCCDDTWELEGVDSMTHRDFLAGFAGPGADYDLEDRVAGLIPHQARKQALACLQWSGLFADIPVGISSGTPARVLEHILNKKWQLFQEDRDRVVMIHRITYGTDGGHFQRVSAFSLTGEPGFKTAMAKAVGLPLAIAVKLFLEGKIKERGVAIPLSNEFVVPILKELADHGIAFETATTAIS